MKAMLFFCTIGRMVGAVVLSLSAVSSLAATNVMLTEVPDYSWDAGCFGTASGNLMGYWDRHGFSNFYTGPTGGGVAPLLLDAAAVIDRRGADSSAGSEPGADYHAEFERRFILVTAENIDDLLRTHLQLW